MKKNNFQKQKHGYPIHTGSDKVLKYPWESDLPRYQFIVILDVRLQF